MQNTPPHIDYACAYSYKAHENWLVQSVELITLHLTCTFEQSNNSLKMPYISLSKQYNFMQEIITRSKDFALSVYEFPIFVISMCIRDLRIQNRLFKVDYVRRVKREDVQSSVSFCTTQKPVFCILQLRMPATDCGLFNVCPGSLEGYLKILKNGKT
ncbi:hypothetical protein DICVIV_07631 [Dictyocaulus viviparus]|uniref:Uncharacterized protein n=1 Tax=Dictyocaulus viviparus TaxID=29172 RepID=A0A0D8XVE6_DICVI|nr:hypothetical protein DICVIV_07631 [Dictyocaulus viviparus]